jgi:hypothetical protein
VRRFTAGNKTLFLLNMLGFISAISHVLLFHILPLHFFIRHSRHFLSHDLTAPVNIMSVAQLPYMRVRSMYAQLPSSGALKQPDQHPVNLTRSRDLPSKLVQIVTHLTCIQDMPVYSLEWNSIITEVVREFPQSFHANIGILP